MTKSENRFSSTDRDASGDKAVTSVGQGELYSPDYALKVDVSDTKTRLKSKQKEEEGKAREENRSDSEMTRKMVANLRGLDLGLIKEMVLEKLAAASVPSEAMENARQFLEGVVRDVTVAAQGLTKDAIHRIKTHLVDILPSLSPAVTRKMVDDAEKEADKEVEDTTGEKGKEAKEDQPRDTGKSTYMSPPSSMFATVAKPFSKL